MEILFFHCVLMNSILEKILKFSFMINYYSQITIDASELNICRLRAISILFTR